MLCCTWHPRYRSVKGPKGLGLWPRGHKRAMALVLGPRGPFALPNSPRGPFGLYNPLTPAKQNRPFRPVLPCITPMGNGALVDPPRPETSSKGPATNLPITRCVRPRVAAKPHGGEKRNAGGELRGPASWFILGTDLQQSCRSLIPCGLSLKPSPRGA